MFGSTYFGVTHFGPEYFGDGADAPPVVPLVTYVDPEMAELVNAVENLAEVDPNQAKLVR